MNFAMIAPSAAALLLALTTPLPSAEPASPLADRAEAETWQWLLERSGREEHVERDRDGRVKWIGFRDEKNERGDYYTGSLDLDAQGHVVKATFNAPHFTNEDLARLANFKRLKTLTTWHNGWVKDEDKSPYSGAGLAHLASLPLESFNVGGSWFNDDGMRAATKLPHLRELQVYHTRISDAGIHALRGNETLRKLVIGPQFSQRLSEKCLADIATLKQLEELEFNEVLLTWTGGLQELAVLKDQLRRLKLEATLISAEDLAKLKAALPSTVIDYTAATPEQQRQLQAAAQAGDEERRRGAGAK
jgi:hypothetical protein